MNMKSERIQKVQELTAQLEEGIEKFVSSEEFLTYLKVMSKFHHYSFNNSILIALQRPDATHIAGFSSWKTKFHRNVKKGEKGIKILSPYTYTIKEIDPETKEEIEHQKLGFKIAYVYDVSQTEGKELPTIGVKELTDDVDGFEKMLDMLIEVSEVPVTFEDINSTAKGYYSHTTNSIVIQKDMPEAQTIKTLVHEMTHSKLHNEDVLNKLKEEGIKLDRFTREVEAESVAYVVCNHFGIDTADYSFSYVAGWSKSLKLEELKCSLKKIQETASFFIDEIEKKLENISLHEAECL